MNTSELYKIFLNYSTICTDSRKIEKDSIFFSLKGDNFNGNKFAKQAIKDGCKYAIIDEKEYLSENCILVEDVLKSLQSLSSYHRETLNIPLIGITGTNGKTTTKELIHSTLSSKYNCYSTKGNLNNHIGVPLSLLEITDKTEIAVIEMGANHIGEIDFLCKLSKPTHGIITNIEMAHLEGFGNFEGVIKAKSELYHFIKNTNGTLFVNNEDSLLKDLSENINKVTYGKNEKSNYVGKLLFNFPFVQIEIENTMINSNLIGDFQFNNILAASCIANHFEIKNSNIKNSIENYIPQNNRTQIIETEKNYLILDAYNANPSSMKSMIESFAKMENKNKICVLGDMLELGSYAEIEHKKIIQLTKKLNLEIILVGEEFSKITTENTYKDIEELGLHLTKNHLKNKTILLKGSRRIRLEKLVEQL